MKVHFWKMQSLKLDETARRDLSNMALATMRCGIELEGQYQPPDVELRCNFDRATCHICRANCCPACSTCVNQGIRNNPGLSVSSMIGEGTCYGWYSTHCAYRTAHGLVAAPEDLNNNECISCRGRRRCCMNCQHCSFCQVCNTCTNPIRGNSERSQAMNCIQVLEKIARVAKCSKHKGDCLPTEYGDFLWAYHDGSVDTELVTAPIPLHDMERVLKSGVDIFRKNSIIMSPAVRAGCHQTFSFDRTFPDVVARNIVQLVRYYLPALLSIGCVEGTEGRAANYRKIPDDPGWSENATYFNEKYEACHVKAQLALNYQPRLIEFRYPDMHPHVTQHMASMILNYAIILYSIHLARGGVASFSNMHWESVTASTRAIIHEGIYDDALKGLKQEMLVALAPHLGAILTNAREFASHIASWSVPPKDEEVTVPFKFFWTSKVLAQPVNTPKQKKTRKKKEEIPPSYIPVSDMGRPSDVFTTNGDTSSPGRGQGWRDI